MITKQLAIYTLLIVFLMHGNAMADDNNQKRDIRPVNLCEQKNSYVIIAEPKTIPALVQVQLPELPGVPAGPVEGLETLPTYAPRLQKYPALAQRQRALDASNQTNKLRALRANWPPLPIYQMFDLWIDPGGAYDVIDANGKRSQIRMGPLYLHPYKSPTMGVRPPDDYVQLRADLAKAMLFHIEGAYYSIYGDCQVAKHVLIEGASEPGTLAALRYAGNPLYACSEELPPPLQSCGFDKDGVIWLADGEGHIALFRTKTLDFLQKCVTIGESTRILIPRNNQSQSVFAFDEKKSVFHEHRIDAEGKASAMSNGLVLPKETEMILFSDDSRVIFLTADSTIVSGRDTDGKKGKTYSVPLKLGKTDKVWEGLYSAREDKIALLVGPIPQFSKEKPEWTKLEETGKSWRQLRLVVVSTLPETK